MKLEKVGNIKSVVDFEFSAEARHITDNAINHGMSVNEDLAAFKGSAAEICSTFAHDLSRDALRCASTPGGLGPRLADAEFQLYIKRLRGLGQIRSIH